MVASPYGPYVRGRVKLRLEGRLLCRYGLRLRLRSLLLDGHPNEVEHVRVGERNGTVLVHTLFEGFGQLFKGDGHLILLSVFQFLDSVGRWIEG